MAKWKDKKRVLKVVHETMGTNPVSVVNYSSRICVETLIHNMDYDKTDKQLNLYPCESPCGTDEEFVLVSTKDNMLICSVSQLPDILGFILL